MRGAGNTLAVDGRVSIGLIHQRRCGISHLQRTTVVGLPASWAHVVDDGGRVNAPPPVFATSRSCLFAPIRLALFSVWSDPADMMTIGRRQQKARMVLTVDVVRMAGPEHRKSGRPPLKLIAAIEGLPRR
jgi:hypothetical protein